MQLVEKTAALAAVGMANARLVTSIEQEAERIKGLQRSLEEVRRAFRGLQLHSTFVETSVRRLCGAAVAGSVEAAVMGAFVSVMVPLLSCPGEVSRTAGSHFIYCMYKTNLAVCSPAGCVSGPCLLCVGVPSGGGGGGHKQQIYF